MPHLLVIGGPSIDTLHINDSIEQSAGGAGLYTALAARRSGCCVSMFSPRPTPIPDSMRPLESRLAAWWGPTVVIEEMPHFTILHEGDNAVYLEFFVGEEEQLDPDGLPQDLSTYDGVHIIPLGNVRQQLRFADACRLRGAKMISSGSFMNLVVEHPNMVRELIEKSDVFFLNEHEATALYGSIDQAVTKPGKLLLITLGKGGAMVIQGTFKTTLPAFPAKVVDPTGAGDTFCGATLSNWLQGLHPIMAARKGMALASEVVEQLGPTALLFDRPAPDVPLDDRIAINQDQVEGVAVVIQSIPEAAPFNFVSDYYPPVNHPSALDFFFVQTLQQFSFWEARQGRYDRPLIAAIDGQTCKGSTYLSYAYLRPLDQDPGFYAPARQASLTKADMLDLFRADDGSDPMPALELHLHKAQDYGRDMLSLGLTPQGIIETANRSSKPLAAFLSILDHIEGYKEDPFRKKSNLLAMILKERPEYFLAISEGESIQPVIDYHVMRFCLRTGMVEIMDTDLHRKVAGRYVISGEEEWVIRYACYLTLQKLIRASGLSMAAVDHIAFNYNRKHCPEMTEPVCPQCAIDPACAHRKDLFQPVIRTSFY
jgi:sugar/nucleoside kinase (ribokinase family)